MDLWIIAAVVICLFIAGVIAINGFVTAQQNANTDSDAKTSCGSCNGKCTAEKNCRLVGCSAQKTGICNCGK